MTTFRLLGTVEATVGSRNIPLGPARQRSTLAALLVDAGRPVPVGTLIDRVWDVSPPSGVRSVVYTYIARLRRVLASFDVAAPLVKDSRGYRLEVDPNQVDLHRVRSLLAESHTVSDANTRRALLSGALDLWSGEPMAGTTSRWTEHFRESLRPFKDEVLCAWADSELEVGSVSPVIERLTQELLESPLSEHLHERLIRALYLGGQRAQALQYYDRVRRRLAEELGTDPSAQLKELHQAILRGELTDEVRLAASLDRRGAGFSSVSPAPAPSTLPADTGDFSGREAETHRLWSLFTEADRTRPPTAVITGAGGVGKTALALHLARRLAPHFPDGQLFCTPPSVEDGREQLSNLTEQLLRALGDEAIPSGTGERTMRLRLLLAKQRVLIVVDDVNGHVPIAPLVPSHPACGLIVTSRCLPYLSGTRMIDLAELSRAESLQLLSRAIGPERVAEDPASAEKLVRMCDGLPLAVRALSARLATHPSWPLRRLVDRMADPAQRLQEIRYGPLDVLDCFDRAFQSLDTVSARLFVRLGAVPETDWFCAERARALLDRESTATVQLLLERLTDHHFLQSSERHGPIYRLRSLQRLYARHRAAQQGEHAS